MFASRILKLRTQNGLVDLGIRIYLPEGSGLAWWCKYEIDWPEGVEQMRVTGIDAIQCLQIAMEMIGAEIYTSAYHKEGDLLYWADWKGYGFPVPGGIRHLLVGDDAKYF